MTACRAGDIVADSQKRRLNFLFAKDIQAHIADGKIAIRLGMTWKDKISFILTENLQIKWVDFLSILKQETGQSAENEQEQFALDFMLMTGELSLLLADLVKLLGGEKTVAQKKAVQCAFTSAYSAFNPVN